MKFELEVVKFDVADVITASGAAPACDPELAAAGFPQG